MICSAIFIGLSVSCKKQEDRRCFKTLGEESQISFSLPDPGRLNLKSGLRFLLVQDDSNYAIVRGGKNIIGQVKWQKAENGYLEIFTEDKCRFLRDQNELPSVEIHLKDVWDLRYEGSDVLETQDTLHLDFLDFVILDACGTMNLTLNIDTLSGTVAYGWGDYKLRGQANRVSLGIRSNGYCDLRDFRVKQLYEVKQQSVGDMHIFVDQVPLSGYITGSGNIYYSGIPSSINITSYSEGQIIKE